MSLTVGSEMEIIMIITTSVPCFGNNRFWIPSAYSNTVFSIDTDGGNYRFEGRLESKILDRYSFGKTVFYNNKVYIFSDISYELWIIYCDNNRIENKEYYNHTLSCSLQVAIDQENAWIIPQSFSAPIIKYNMLSDKVDIIKWDNLTRTNLDEYGITLPDIYQNKLFFLSRKLNMTTLFILDICNCNIINKEIEEFESVSLCKKTIKGFIILGKLKSGHTAICTFNDEFIMIKKHIIEEILIPSGYYGIPFSSLIPFNNEFYLIPLHYLYIYKYNPETGTVVKIDYSKEIKSDISINKVAYFSNPIVKDDELVLFSKNVGFIIILNMRTDSFRVISYNICLSLEEKKDYFGKYLLNGLRFEDKVIDLNEFISII